MMSDCDVKLSKYILIFSGYFLALITMVNVFALWFDIDLSASVNLVTLFGAGYASAIQFVKDFKRAPSKQEQRLLSLGCLLAAFIISIIASAILLLVALGDNFTVMLEELFGTTPTLVWGVIWLVVGGLYYFILSLIFGWVARKYVAKSITV